MRLALLLTADYAVVDASGKLNILGAFTTINAQQFPSKHLMMYLVVKLQAEFGEYSDTRKLRIRLVDEDGAELLHISSDFKIPESNAGKRGEFTAVIGFRDLEFPRPGVYEFIVYVDKDHKGEFPIQLVQLEQHEE